MRRKSLALLLVISLLFTSTTACTVCTTITKPTPTKRSLTVYPLHVERTEEGWSGGYGTSKITVETNPAKTVKVGVYEEEVRGAGPQWKAGAWVASIMGTTMLGRDISDYKFTFEVNGYVDGASGSALETAGVLALLLGDEIKKDVTMTGIINPDGTIGPVGGIPQKIDGAQQAKKKKVLIPNGQRYDYDFEKEDMVDVVALGKKKGITVKEVASIYEAYKELTGKDLPKGAGATTKKIDLPSETYDKVKAKAKRWYSRYLEERAKYDQLVVPFADTSVPDALVQQADELASLGDKYLGQGLVASSYNQITAAVLYTVMAYHLKKATEQYMYYGGLTAVVNYLDTVNPSDIKMDAVLDDLKARKANTLADTMVLAESYGALSVAWGLVELAKGELEQQMVTEEEILEGVLTATLYYALASHVVDMAEDVVDIGMGVGKAKPAERVKLQRISEGLRKASEANLEYFDTIVLKDFAESRGISIGVAQGYLASRDLGYAFARGSATGAQILKRKLGKTEASAIAVLGNSLTSYGASSELLAKYYSLGAETDDEGNITAVGNEKALISMLDLSEDAALENINAATKAGASPVLAMLRYEGGKIEREGDLDSKFTALTDFWTASVEGRLLTVLAGMKLTRAGEEGEGGVRLLGE